MAYDEELAERIRAVVGRKKGVSEKEMFGGLCFMIDGKMFVGIMKEGDLMVRIDKTDHAAAIKKPHARTMDFTKRPMLGFVLIRPAGIKTAKALASWIEQGEAYARSLPAKKPKKRPAPKK